jgi:transcriptional regulator with XRE-family HTH domain
MVLDKIRFIRVYKGYSQEYMAYKLGISQRAYSKIERGETKLTLYRLNQICKLLEIDMNEIIHDVA